MEKMNEVIFRSPSGKSISAEDAAYMRLASAILTQNIDDFKEGIARYKLYKRGLANGIEAFEYIIPSVIFFKSKRCSSMIAFLGLEADYDIFTKLDRLYNTKHYSYNVFNIVRTYKDMALYLQKILHAFDVSIDEFCKGYLDGMSVSKLRHYIYIKRKTDNPKIKKPRVTKPQEEMDSLIYDEICDGLKKLFNEYEMDDFFVPYTNKKENKHVNKSES